jgi:membrane-associated progesterone receptor component
LPKQGLESEREKTADLGHLPPGNTPGKPTLVAIKGTVFDVSKNDAYGPKGQYHGKIIPGDAEAFITGSNPPNTIPSSILSSSQLTSSSVFAGKDPSRALAQSSLKPEDCRPDWYDLPDQAKTVLGEWYTFFSKRYNIVGKIQGAANT